MSLWDQVKTNMAEWYAVAADKTGEMARVGVRKYDQFALSREIERGFQELGGHVYGLLGAGRTAIAEDAKVVAACERIRVLERQLAEKEREIRAILEARTAGARAAAVAAEESTVGEAAPGRRGPGGPDAPDRLPGSLPIPEEPVPVDLADEDIEAAIDPGTARTGADEEPWDEEIAVWHEPLDLDDEMPVPEEDEDGQRDESRKP